MNQNALTAISGVLSLLSKENCNVVDVTAEKKVAIVVKFWKFEATCSCSLWTTGMPGLIHQQENIWNFNGTTISEPRKRLDN